jgi:hypothetical protein
MSRRASVYQAFESYKANPDVVELALLLANNIVDRKFPLSGRARVRWSV